MTQRSLLEGIDGDYLGVFTGRKYEAPHNGTDTSKAAAESVTPTAESLCGRILAYIKTAGAHGVTSDELEDRWMLRHQTCSARFYDLHMRGFIYDSGQRRPTRSGRNAKVWVAK